MRSLPALRIQSQWRAVKTINYDKYQEMLLCLPAPVLGSQLPDVQIDIAALLAYAHSKGVKANELSDEVKNRFIIGGTVQSLQESVRNNSPYKNLAEWNAANE